MTATLFLEDTLIDLTSDFQIDSDFYSPGLERFNVGGTTEEVTLGQEGSL